MVHGGGHFPAYVGLQLRANRSLSLFDEGIYTCIIPDENGVQRTLHTGIYRHGFLGKCTVIIHSHVVQCVFHSTLYVVAPTVEVTSTASPMLVLKCTSTGAPGVINWAYLGSSRTYITDGEHQIVHTLLNGVTATFESRLTFLRHPYSIDTGERICIVTSTYVSTNSSETNTSTTVGMQS